MDREAKAVHELQMEVKDQGNPPRSAKAIVRVMVTDVNDNTPVIVEPEETVLSVREELPAGTEVVRIRAVDTDEGNNASITYSFVIGEFPVYLAIFSLLLAEIFIGQKYCIPFDWVFPFRRSFSVHQSITVLTAGRFR